MSDTAVSGRFAHPARQTSIQTYIGFLQAAYTVICVPPHKNQDITPAVADMLKDSALPVQQPLDTELQNIRAVMRSANTAVPLPDLHVKELTGLMGVLMQFTVYLPRLRPYCAVDYMDVENLYTAVVNNKIRKPLGFSQQLAVALTQTDGDLPEAVWRLFITSRQYARWSDEESIKSFPDISQDEACRRMVLWANSLRATKDKHQYHDQDVAGDTYYCWTHVLAKLLYSNPQVRGLLIVRLQALALQYGTTLNHTIAHRISPQSVKSDHYAAARYGNAIGDALLAYYQTRGIERRL